MNFGDRLREIREGKEWSQERLAKEIGSRQPVVSRWEGGLQKPNFEYLQRLSKALGVKIKDLVGEE